MPRTDLIGVRETARRLGVHENTVRKYAERDDLPAVRLPGSGFRRFRVEDVERMRAEMFREFPDEAYEPRESTAKRERLVTEDDFA